MILRTIFASFVLVSLPAYALNLEAVRSEKQKQILSAEKNQTPSNEEDECQTSSDCPDGYHCRKQADPHVCVPNE